MRTWQWSGHARDLNYRAPPSPCCRYCIVGRGERGRVDDRTGYRWNAGDIILRAGLIKIIRARKCREAGGQETDVCQQPDTARVYGSVIVSPYDATGKFPEEKVTRPGKVALPANWEDGVH